MDTWKEDQLRKMRLGGNLPFKAFMKAYPPEGGYTPGMPPSELYHTWAASQYREKLNADVEGVAWSPSSPPPATSAEASGQRKSRASKPISSAQYSSTRRQPTDDDPVPGDDDEKTAKEAYFASLGLPPSQGGRYEGFGSPPTPEPASQHPSYGLSSANAPTFDELQRDPMKALSKGWSLFAAVAAGAGKAVNENLIQPGMEKAMDPTLRATAAGYVSQASKMAADAAAGANDWGKNQFGVDVAGKARETIMGPSTRGTYSTVESHSGNDWDKDDDDDFFERELAASKSDQAPKATQPASATATASTSKKPAAQDDDDDDWKDF
ncbi:Zn finger-containing GTPase- Activating Protein for ARF [Tulasnella sp. UAMH 9824]|nr:Zn finger-containing GTPase- Activating Protein for ARF [Tulasnella sp. UAMH 9824]